MRENVLHCAREAADTLTRLLRGEASNSGSKPDNKMQIVLLARRVAAVRQEMERRAARAAINE